MHVSEWLTEELCGWEELLGSGILCRITWHDSSIEGILLSVFLGLHFLSYADSPEENFSVFCLEGLTEVTKFCELNRRSGLGSIWYVENSLTFVIILCVNLNGPHSRHIFSYTSFWVCLWECIWMWLSFESVDSVRQIALPSVGKSHLICWRPELNKNPEWGKFALCVFELGHWSFSVFRLIMEPSHQLSWVHSLLTHSADLGTPPSS